MEETIRNGVLDPNIYLVVRHIHMDFYDKYGSMRYEFIDLKVSSKEQQKSSDTISRAIMEEIGLYDDLFLGESNYRPAASTNRKYITTILA